MRLTNFRKETSERSDNTNWTKDQLISNTNFFFDGIEGCNQNAKNQTTHLLERAHVDIDLEGIKSKENVLQSIVELETKDALKRKINFASAFGLPLSYVLHNDRTELVFLLEFRSIDDVDIVNSFSSYERFGLFLAAIKGWKSTKKFREYDDLPKIDKVLRKHGNPWPTNIDCFCSDDDGPIAIIEYQNAKAIGVLKHSNNDYFLCKQKSKVKTNFGLRVKFHDDIRRWTSQEILRVQSGLPLIVITWSQVEPHYQLKEVKKITFPDFETQNHTDRWKRMAEYKEDLHRFVTDPSDPEFQVISNRKSLSYAWLNDEVIEDRHNPPLSRDEMTFPYIYWKRKALIQNSKDSLPVLFTNWISLK